MDTAPGLALVPAVMDGPGGTSITCAAAGFVAGELRRRGVRAQPTALPAPRGSTLVSAVFGQRGLAVACDRQDAEVARKTVDAWHAVARARRVVLAAPRSFCAGVERAIEIVESALRRHGAPVYVRRQIVHNAHVVADLESRGAIFVDELDPIPAGAVVVFSAHGVAPAVREEADRRGLEVIDATCPLVAKVHSEARRFAARGDTVLLIGHDGHDEVEGTLGQLPGQIQLVQDVAEARSVRVPDPARVSYLTQTTLASDETADVLSALRARLPQLGGPGSADICYATTNRQEAVAAIAAECDLVLVVGSANSSNSLRLVEVARRLGKAAHLIDDAGDVRPQWLHGVEAIGMTAGASTPAHLVDEVVAALEGLGPLTVTERRTSEETITFVLPPALRTP